MNRLTKAVGNNRYVVDDLQIQHCADGYTGDAVTRLAKFENIYEDLLSKKNDLSRELEKLKLEGKTNTTKFKQLLANKITNNNVIILFETYGLCYKDQ